MKTLLPACFCGETLAERRTVHGLDVLVCECGALRQNVEFTLGEYADWYREVYHDVVYTHTYNHDRKVAAVRLDSYGILSHQRVLDVGCGNNAFVDECAARGIDATGQDLAEQAAGPRTYVGHLHDIAFPTESFDVVTVHDVLEHVPDPVAFLQEIRRVLKQGGTLLLDFPRFFHERGLHHWKVVEHLWLLDAEPLVRLLQRSGFDVVTAWHPIESKIVVRATAKPMKRISVLVPPGIGDSYWVMTKMAGLMKREGAEGVDIYIQDSSPRRTDPYLKNVAFAAVRGFKTIDPYHTLLAEAYRQNARTIFPNEFDVDFFVSYNGVLTYGGKRLEDVDPDLGTEWRPRTFMSKEAVAAREKMEEHGKYIVAYFIAHGMYKRWLREFNIHRIERMLKSMERRGYKVVVVGATWDKESVGDILGKFKQRVNMVGKTSFDQLYGIVSGASAVVGFPSGASLLGPTLNVPTVLIWNRFFDKRFWVNCVPPDAPYVALDSLRLTPEGAASAVEKLIVDSARP